MHFELLSTLPDSRKFYLEAINLLSGHVLPYFIILLCGLTH
jgi:hypothetical protein